MTTEETPLPFADTKKPAEENISTIPKKVYAIRLFGLSSFYFGVSYAFCIITILWPKQISMIVKPSSKEFYNGVIGIFCMIMNSFSPPISGAISDRMGRRQPLMMVGMLVAATFTMVSAFFIFPLRFGGFEFPFFLLVGGLAIAQGSYSGLIPDIIPEDTMGLTAGILGLVRSFGNLAGVLFTGLILEFIPYPFNFIFAYGLCSIIFLSSYLTSFTIIQEEKKQTAHSQGDFSLRNFIMGFYLPPSKYCNFYFVFLSRWFFEMGTFGIVSFIQYYLSDVYNDEYAILSSSLLISLILIIGIISSPIAGYISDKVSRKIIVIFSCVFTGIIMIANIFLTLYDGKLWMVYIVCGILGIGIGSFYAVDLALGIDSLPDKENMAKDMGIWSVSSTIPSMISPFITGLVLDRTKIILNVKGAWALALGLCGFWYLLSGAFIIPIRAKRKSNIVMIKDDIIGEIKKDEIKEIKHEKEMKEIERLEDDLTDIDLSKK